MAIVIPSATERGAAICRDLLNSNAFVLGIDNVDAHETTRTSGGSHFQFLKYGEGNPPQGREVMESVEKKFGKDAVDFLIYIGDGEIVRQGIVKGIVDEMLGRSDGAGMLLEVVTDVRSENGSARVSG